MNQSKFDQLHRGLSTQAKKVYDCIPMVEAWSRNQIMQELFRKNISMSDVHVVMGCINSLISIGLVMELPQVTFRRVQIRAKSHLTEVTIAPEVAVTKESAMSQPIPIKPVIVASTSPIDRLSALATRLRDLATDMDSAAIELAEQAQKNEIETTKMRQLQALLKSLG